MPGGDFALDTRLELARRAERSLDVQYYHIENDDTGRYFLRTLRDAARRGVRVRLLMDDLYTSGEDALLLGLAATPNLELRLFNPFPAGRSSIVQRFAASLLNFDRVQRRMHNKLFIADGAMAVAGGRNIGNQYFTRTTGPNFLDLDTFVAGALLPRLGQLFDQYWNSEYVVPLQAVVKAIASDTELQASFERMTAPDSTPRPPALAPNDLLGYGPIVNELDSGMLGLVWARAEAYADSPDRVVGKTASYGGVALLDVDSVRYNVREQIRRARNDVSVISPYLIPGKGGLEVMQEVHGRGVRMSILTNSLAATDEPLVHTAYQRYRPAMLKLGIDLYELSSVRTRASVRLGLFGSYDRPAACQVGGDRPAHRVHRLDEFRPALEPAEHRNRSVHREPRNCAASAETDRDTQAARRLQAALCRRHRGHRMGQWPARSTGSIERRA